MDFTRSDVKPANFGVGSQRLNRFRIFSIYFTEALTPLKLLRVYRRLRIFS